MGGGAAAEIRGLGGDISALGKGIEEPSKYCRKRANITITKREIAQHLTIICWSPPISSSLFTVPCHG